MPGNRPPWGTESAVVTPATRVSGRWTLEGLMAVSASIWGVTLPSSSLSCVSATEPTSDSPIWVPESMKPG